MAWHPDSTLLAVPGTENDVVCYDRDDWKPVSYLTGHHTARVNLVTYSPNGVARCRNAPSIRLYPNPWARTCAPALYGVERCARCLPIAAFAPNIAVHKSVCGSMGGRY